MIDTKELIEKQCNIMNTVITDATSKGITDQQLHISIFNSVNKWLISYKISTERNGNGNGNGNKPTEAQLKYATYLQIESPEKYTKKELSDKINQVK